MAVPSVVRGSGEDWWYNPFTRKQLRGDRLLSL
jgi:hypothetical protein